MTAALTSVRVVGGLVPPDVLAGVLAGTVGGLSSSDYHLGGEAPREAAARAWSHLLPAYRRFRDELARLPAGDPAVGLTRERLLSLLLADLGYGRVPSTPAGGLVVAGKAYPISHLWGATPVHLLGWGVDLDRRAPGVAGAARAPHAMVQELLNRTDDYLWAVLSNGRLLRLLRDSTTLTGQAYVQVDLEAMFDGELFAEFALLFLLAHQSRVEVPDGGRPADCWLERWRTTAVSQGVRALSLLREGVQRALETLGTGFLQHPANGLLRERLADPDGVRLTDVHAALLRLAYRLLFWMVAEDREALLRPDAPATAAQRYADHFSSARLRRLALRRHGSAHDDLWQAATLVLDALGRADGEPRLGLPGLGGLFGRTEADVLAGCRLGNTSLLSAIRALSVVQPKGQPRRLVDFANLGAEELGSIYESLLELVPRHDPTTHAFTLQTLAGNDRKTTGSYYTPSELVELVLDTALDPVLNDAEKGASTAEEAAERLLALRVCDPAIGSGHFMVAAARRIATRLATVRSGEVDPTPTSHSDALHDVVARCIYGVDINPMAADLAKVSLWLTAMTPGKPLSFLDHHIKVGNALLGTTPALLAAGIPDAAYTALTGDDKSVATAWKKRNAAERAGQGDLFDDAGIDVTTAGLRKSVAEVADRAATATTVADTAWAAQRYADLQADEETVRRRRVADAWCVAFVGPKTPDAEVITTRTLEQIAAGTAPEHVLALVDKIATRHRLFHWHLEFPEVLRVPNDGPAGQPYGWIDGWNACLGNPPWERVKLQDREFFASRAPAIAEAKNSAARSKAVAALTQSDPELLAQFQAAKRRIEAESAFLRSSGRYPLCGVGDVNTYSVFAEHFAAVLSPRGRSGVITPTGLATEATTSEFFAQHLRQRRVAAFLDFENEARIFEGVHNQLRFAVTSMTGGEAVPEVALAFYTRYVGDVASRKYAISAEEILLLNPNSGTLPLFRSRRDAEITLACYRRHPVLMQTTPVSNPWGLRFGMMIQMSGDSESFRTSEELRSLGAHFDGWSWSLRDVEWLPLYEAKMLAHWNHRYATYDGATQAQLNKGTLPKLDRIALDDAAVEPLARYWIDRREVAAAIPGAWSRKWFLGWRNIARASDVRTFQPCVAPDTAIGHAFLLALPQAPGHGPRLQALWSSLIFDYIARQKISGSNMVFFIVKQLCCPFPKEFAQATPWSGQTLDEFVRPRVLELTYTSHRMAPYAVDVMEGVPGETDSGPPFRWLPDRRAQLRAELDAAMLHLYGLDRADAEHVLDSFFVLRKYEERDHGEYVTKRLVLTEYDDMAKAAATGVPYASPLDPPPGQGPRHPRTT